MCWSRTVTTLEGKRCVTGLTTGMQRSYCLLVVEYRPSQGGGVGLQALS